MTEDTDVFRAAALHIKQHGEDAPIHAAMRADELLMEGDVDGAAVWKRIVKVVEALLAGERSEGTRSH